jgi:hypothetical protein
MPAPASLTPDIRGGSPSANDVAAGRRNATRKPKPARAASRLAQPTRVGARRSSEAATRVRALRVEAEATPVQGEPEEGAGPAVFGPIGTALSSVDGHDVIPTALVALATFALLLFGLASAPFPARARTGAMLVHMRGSIALAGAAALAIAVATFVVLSLL